MTSELDCWITIYKIIYCGSTFWGCDMWEIIKNKFYLKMYSDSDVNNI